MKYIEEFDKSSWGFIAIDVKEFIGGLASACFNREGGSNNLVIVSKSDIYYGEKLVVKKGDAIPHFYQLQSREDVKPSNKANIIIDLRLPGTYGSDFDFMKLNDGSKNGRDNFNVTFIPR